MLGIERPAVYPHEPPGRSPDMVRGEDLCILEVATVREASLPAPWRSIVEPAQEKKRACPESWRVVFQARIPWTVDQPASAIPLDARARA